MNKKQRMYAQIEEYGANLNKIFNTGIDNVKLCKALKRLEAKAHKLAEDYCNGDIEADKYNEDELWIIRRAGNLLLNKSVPIFVNGDPRGYALKIDSEYVFNHGLDIYTDMGGYGILAPEFNGD